ncbi:MAG TPA: formate dehydrogenase accessory sulfurtransferase FdhD [Candidatus Binatia bacterium]
MPIATSISGEITRIAERSVQSDDDLLAIEEPLEIRIASHPISVTMRTPGHDPELAVGFLFTEGIIKDPSDVDEVVGPKRDLANVVSVRLRRGVRFDPDKLKRHFYTTSSCGVCGKTSLSAIRQKHKPVVSDLKISSAVLYSLPDRLREEQETFEETGGLHAAALFDAEGRLLYLREDVGRHNAVDKIVGRALLSRMLPLDRHVLMVSGRTSFEIMQKALAAGVPIVAAVSAPSSLAVAFAREFNMTLVGFLRGRKCNVYSRKERIQISR